MKKILIIGGSGQIGTEIIKKYYKNNLILNIDLKDNKIFRNKNYFFFKLNIFKKKKKLKDLYIKLFKKTFTPDIIIDTSYLVARNWNKNNFDDSNYETLSSNINANLTTSIWNILSILQILKKKERKASVVLFSSIYGIIAQDYRLYNGSSIKENIVYNLSKSAIIHFVKMAANYYIKKGIRINCISPGGIEGKNKVTNKKISFKIKNKYSSKSPIGRMAIASELLSAVDFLISPGSSYVVGANVVVDGGWSII